MAAKKRITAGDIRHAMSKRWCAPEWAIMWEVANGTGSSIRRYADAVMMSLWPSRGLELHGIEIKVTRSDWKREAADPSKAETIAKFCDRWWIHTPPGVVDDVSDLPPAWGLREWTGKQWRTIKEAEKTDAEAVTRVFLAAMLRRADETMRSLILEASQEARSTVDEERRKMNEQFGNRVDEAVKRKTESLQSAADKMDAFEKAFGDDFFRRWSVHHEHLGRAAKALVETHTSYGSFEDITRRLRAAADELDQIDQLIVGEKAA